MVLETRGGEPALGVGWLVVIAVGGGIIIFTGVGLLLSWWIKKQPETYTTTTVCSSPAYSDDAGVPTSTSTVTKLAKKRYVDSSVSISGFSSRISLQTLHGLSTTMSRRISRRFTIDEEAAHGPKVKKTARESWFSRESWFGRAPSLPSLDDMQMTEDQRQFDEYQAERLEMAKRVDRIIVASRAMEDDSPGRGRSRVSTPSHPQGHPFQAARMSATEDDLKYILQSTELRLRQGSSQSPTKTPQHSPIKDMSPIKTPGSYRITPLSETTPETIIRAASSATSPTKIPIGYEQLSPTQRNMSACSATDSLLEAATQELGLPSTALSSPSKARHMEEKPHRASTESDVSSSLSTLYSVGDTEDAVVSIATTMKRVSDPFVEDNVARPAVMGPRPMGRTTPLSAVGRPTSVDVSAVPAPLRTPTMSEKKGRRESWKVQSERRGVMFASPKIVEVSPKRRPRQLKEVSSDEALGETSLISESFYSSDSDRTEVAEAITPLPRANASTMTPTKKGSSVVTKVVPSSPLNDEEIIRLLALTAPSQPVIALPQPRLSPVDESAIPIPLSPRSKLGTSSPTPRQKSRNCSAASSTSSSNYDRESLASVKITLDHSAIRGQKGLPSLGSTIAELRRMNSVVSSYSVASFASTTTGEHASTSGETTLTQLRGGGFAPDRTMSKAARTGNKNYHNLGVRTTGSPRKGHERNRSSLSVKGRENLGLGLNAISPGLRDGASRANLAPLSETDESGRGLGRRRRKEEMRLKNESSAETLGLYDSDGFLKSSPDLELVAIQGERLRL